MWPRGVKQIMLKVNRAKLLHLTKGTGFCYPAQCSEPSSVYLAMTTSFSVILWCFPAPQSCGSMTITSLLSTVNCQLITLCVSQYRAVRKVTWSNILCVCPSIPQSGKLLDQAWCLKPESPDLSLYWVAYLTEFSEMMLNWSQSPQTCLLTRFPPWPNSVRWCLSPQACLLTRYPSGLNSVRWC